MVIGSTLTDIPATGTTTTVMTKMVGADGFSGQTEGQMGGQPI